MDIVWEISYVTFRWDSRIYYNCYSLRKFLSRQQLSCGKTKSAQDTLSTLPISYASLLSRALDHTTQFDHQINLLDSRTRKILALRKSLDHFNLDTQTEDTSIGHLEAVLETKFKDLIKGRGAPWRRDSSAGEAINHAADLSLRSPTVFVVPPGRRPSHLECRAMSDSYCTRSSSLKPSKDVGELKTATAGAKM